ncbi:MAG: hypothetical protein AB1705_27150, partial [Verrucomicrobiota bacterium]
MQNPFQRLKHYALGDNDPKENHATECLASCLAFSTVIREHFIAFLFRSANKQIPERLKNTSKVAIVTQLQASGYGDIDLVLDVDGYAAVVEIKVDAKEMDPHHDRQLKAYQEWIKQERGGKGALFTLVRDPNRDFRPEDYGATRCRWSDLHEEFKALAKQHANATDGQLLDHLCNYLEIEGIVDIMDYKKLTDYGKGWAAEKVLASLFRKTKERLKLSDRESELYDPKGVSPSFQFGRDEWKKSFGNGWNNKVYVWFCTPATEGAKCKNDEFR